MLESVPAEIAFMGPKFEWLPLAGLNGMLSMASRRWLALNAATHTAAHYTSAHRHWARRRN